MSNSWYFDLKFEIFLGILAPIIRSMRNILFFYVNLKNKTVVPIENIYFDNVSLTGSWSSDIATTFETLTLTLLNMVPYWKFLCLYIAITRDQNDVAKIVVK